MAKSVPPRKGVKIRPVIPNDPQRGLDPQRRTINVALQGGGAHGAFAWGVLDYLIEEGSTEIEAISGTSAGSMNAVVYAYGRLRGGFDGARQALHDFWRAVSDAGQLYSPLRKLPWEHWWPNDQSSIAYESFKSLSRVLSPYQLNPLDFNPLKRLLEEHVDFEALRHCQSTKLFITATNVRNGQPRVFTTDEITADVVMASACLPFLFKAVEIQGEHYWDGGYTGNPSLWPFHYQTHSRDLVIVHINPIERAALPRSAAEIEDRINEISFNDSLFKELRSIAFVQKLLHQGWIKDEYRDQLKDIFVHAIRADRALGQLSVASKLSSDWTFISELANRGRGVAADWFKQHGQCIGVRSSLDLHRDLLDTGAALHQ